MKIKNIIFDFGGVLVDWNPRYVFKKYFEKEEEMEWFLANICTNEWNMEQDRGRSMAEATKLLQNQYPEYREMIAKFYGEWEDMLKSEIPGTVKILKELKQKYSIFGLTNWSAETIDIAYNRFNFFDFFDGILVSGEEKLIKPDPKIYELLLNRYQLKAEECFFIDDNQLNVKSAENLGIKAVQFLTPEKLKIDLKKFNIL